MVIIDLIWIELNWIEIRAREEKNSFYLVDKPKASLSNFLDYFKQVLWIILPQVDFVVNRRHDSIQHSLRSGSLCQIDLGATNKNNK